MNEQALPDSDIDQKEIDAAKWLIKSLLLLLKTYGLYSERHPFCEKTLKEFHTKLLSFLEEYDSLLLHVEKRRLLYEGEAVLSGPANEENLAFSFFRDGVDWLEILEGIELWETAEIIKILHTYKRLPEEAEGSRALAAEISPERAFSLAGATASLRDLVVLIGRCDLLVTSDCGPAHMAALTSTPIVSVFGPETPRLYSPLSPRNVSLWAGLACSPCLTAFNHRRSPCRRNVCMEQVSVDQVYEAARRQCPALAETR